ncbi:myb-related transcription factor, partner of profilin-like [Plakobranchus ocellatus]|uniref:Myb-related transcription factor, partner of profilin-like n=1 Tax=Plakobranchus ocellatus TaxID=259542 RepID=A0AAV3YW94_9GAST|nr:myb-related transcription factor, partner of profilin-like [Plakobranchus ocellatus]
MDEGEGSRRNRKPNYSRDEVLTIICGVQENKFNLLKKSCTVSANKVKQAGWKAICDRLNFFNPDRQRTVEEVRKKWKDLSAQARNDLMCKRNLAASAGNGAEDGEDVQHDSGGRDQKETAAGEFTPLILAILSEVGSIDMSAEDTGLLNINLNSLGGLADQPADQEAIYDTVVIQKQDNASEASQQSQNDADQLDDSDSRKRMRKPNYTKKDVLTLIQGVSDHKFALLQKICTHTTNKVKTEGWATICETVNSYNPDVMRTTEELRKKWKDLSKQARQDLANLRAAMAAGGNKPATVPGEFSALCLPILADAGLCDVTQEEINALKVNSVATVISLQQAAGAEFVTTSQANVLPSVMEKECDSFVGDSPSFGTAGLIGAPTAVGAVASNINSADAYFAPQPAPGEFALSTLASVSASKLKEKLREKLASGGPTTHSDIQDFQAAQAELQAVGVEVRLIENHPHHHSQQQQQQQLHEQQHQQSIESNSNNTHHQQHITLDGDPNSIIPTTLSSGTTIISTHNPQHPQQQHITQGLQMSAATPQHLFRASIVNRDNTKSLKRKNSNSSSSGSIGNIISSGAISTGGHAIFPIPVSIHPAPPTLSTPMTVLTGTPLVTGNMSPTSPTTSWVAEKQALEREKLQSEVEVLRLQKIKLRLEIEALVQQRQPESCQLLEDCLK